LTHLIDATGRPLASIREHLIPRADRGAATIHAFAAISDARRGTLCA